MTRHNNKTSRKYLRREVLSRRDGLTRHERVEKSMSITSRVVGLPEVSQARIILAYMHFRSEVRTSDMIHCFFTSGQTVALPLVIPETSRLKAVAITDIDRQVGPGYYGIPEPLPSMVQTATCDPGTIDVVIVPGTVFDRLGGRLGYGGGYYDRFLANEAPAATRIGLAYSLQIVDRVETQPHDQRMDFVVTEENLFDCRRNRDA